MADIKISALPGASTLDGTETIPLVQGGTTKKVTTDQFLIKDGSGNVGLGVTPSAWTLKALDVSNSASFYGDGSVWSWVAGVSQNAYFDGAWKYRATGHTAERYEIGAGHSWYTAPSGTAGNAISFTQAMTLDASGNLGIGTASPNGKLTVVGNTINTVADNTYAAAFNAPTGNIRITPYTTAYSSPSIIAYSAGYAGFAPLTFDASRISLATGNTERARIDASGNLLVGATTASGKLHVTNANNVSGDTAAYLAMGSNTNDASSYFLQCVTSGVGAKAFILGNGNMQNANNSYGAFSDARLKENVTDASPKLAKLMQVRIVNYTLKSDPDKAKLIGVVAQELEKVSPGLIEETADFEDVKKTREVTKSVPVTEQVTVQREQKTVEVVDGKAVVTVTLVDEQTTVPVVDQYPLFDTDGQPVLEVDTPEVPEVLDEDGNVTQPAVPATYRQAMHSVPRMQDVTETEEYTERVPLGTVTKSVKYSVFVPMLVKAVQEQQTQIESLAARLAALEAKRWTR